VEVQINYTSQMYTYLTKLTKIQKKAKNQNEFLTYATSLST
jgi:hypothetical protein